MSSELLLRSSEGRLQLPGRQAGETGILLPCPGAPAAANPREGKAAADPNPASTAGSAGSRGGGAEKGRGSVGLQEAEAAWVSALRLGRDEPGRCDELDAALAGRYPGRWRVPMGKKRVGNAGYPGFARGPERGLAEVLGSWKKSLVRKTAWDLAAASLVVPGGGAWRWGAWAAFVLRARIFS